MASSFPPAKLLAMLSTSYPVTEPGFVAATPNGEPAPGLYVSDGRRLFRIVSQVAPGLGPASAELEDCSTLTVERYSAEELYEMELWAVTPAD